MCVVWNCIFQTCMFPKCNFWKYTLLSQWSWLNFALFVYFPLLKGRERGAQSKLMLPCFAQVLVKCGRLTSPPPLHNGWICSTFLHCMFAQMWPQIACIVTLQALLKFLRLIPSMRSFFLFTLYFERGKWAQKRNRLSDVSEQSSEVTFVWITLPKLSDLLYTTQKLLLKTMIEAGGLEDIV